MVPGKQWAKFLSVFLSLHLYYEVFDFIIIYKAKYLL